MKVHGIDRQIDADSVPGVDRHSGVSPGNANLAGIDRKSKGASVLRDTNPHQIGSQSRNRRAFGQLLNIPLQPPVGGVNGHQHKAKIGQRAEHQKGER